MLTDRHTPGQDCLIRGSSATVAACRCRVMLWAATIVVVLAIMPRTTAVVRAQENLLEGLTLGQGKPNVQGPTLGGKQFWSDQLIFHGWRIQQNVVTGHYRLLDDENVRQAWGDFEHCRTRLDQIKRERSLPPLSDTVVIALHGVIRSRGSMDGICNYLSETGDFTTLNMSYASTRQTLAEHAKSLDRVIDNLGDVQQIHFVAHSMGNLVIRHYLGDHTDPERGIIPDPRIKRIVMLGPPNNGTQLGARFKSNPLYRVIWGVSGVQLAEKWEEVEPQLAIPHCEFGIVAGGRNTEAGNNPLLDGDDDLVVSVEETRLPGAQDFLILPVLHSTMMNDVRVQAATLAFFRQGRFASQ